MNRNIWNNFFMTHQEINITGTDKSPFADFSFEVNDEHKT